MGGTMDGEKDAMVLTADRAEWLYLAGMEISDIAAQFSCVEAKIRAMLELKEVSLRRGRPHKNRPRTIAEAVTHFQSLANRSETAATTSGEGA